MDKKKFKEEMEKTPPSLDTTPQNLVKIIRRAQMKATVAERNRIIKQPYWWNGEIADKRKKCIAMRKPLTRVRTRDPQDQRIV
ncbi:hypothetical protein JTB14_018413 [Gonioctena quinquepunctata]|nr:hypothetical protein JTB14_018413 [Gonioctena quinquepunctata]